jgi:hypothetical protein
MKKQSVQTDCFFFGGRGIGPGCTQRIAERRTWIAIAVAGFLPLKVRSGKRCCQLGIVSTVALPESKT